MLALQREIQVDKRLHYSTRIHLLLLTEQTDHLYKLLAILGYQQVEIACQKLLTRLGQYWRFDCRTQQCQLMYILGVIVREQTCHRSTK